MGFWQRGKSVFQKGLDELYIKYQVYEKWENWDWENDSFPTLLDLLEIFKSKKFMSEVKGYGKQSLYSIIDKLESFIIQVRPIIYCQRGFSIEKLVNEKKPISYSLDGISSEYQNIIIVTLILQYAHYFKAHGPRNVLKVLLFFDEAKGIFGKQNEDMFILKDLVAKIREWCIGLVCADQIPSEIPQFFFSNISTLMAFRHSSGKDIKTIMIAAGSQRPSISRRVYRKRSKSSQNQIFS